MLAARQIEAAWRLGRADVRPYAEGGAAIGYVTKAEITAGAETDMLGKPVRRAEPAS